MFTNIVKFLNNIIPNRLKNRSTNVYTIAVIGAGVSGLHVAKSLKQNGHAVTIFEAKSRPGGRIHQLKDFHTSPIDLGAQWIHGKNTLYKVVKQVNLSVYEDKKNESTKVIYKGSLLNDFPSEFYEFIKKITQQTPLKDDMSVEALLKNLNKDEDFISLVESTLTDTATSAKNLSVNEISKSTNKLITQDYQFANTTMYGFIQKNYLSTLDANIIYNAPIKSIDYRGNTVTLLTGFNDRHEFDKVVVTVPISQLKMDKIEFVPSLPPQKLEAFNMIGMDKGLKIFLKFSKKFFNHSIFNGEYAGYYIDPTKNSDNTETALLTSLIMGTNADSYYANPKQAIQNYLLDLDKLFNGQASKYFLDSYVQDWGNEDYINGVYSYTKPGGYTAREIARQPINNKVFFAGEAMSIKHNYGTVDGAIESAIDVLNEIE